MTRHVVLLPGDGIGPEVVRAAVRVLDTVAPFHDLLVRYSTVQVGGAALDTFGVPLRPEDLRVCSQADALLLGAVGGPTWDGLPVERRPEHALLQLRSQLRLPINLRPVRWTETGGARSPVRPSVSAGTDIAFVRELTGGVYFGKPSFMQRWASGRQAVDTAQYSESQVLAVLEFAYALARQRRGKVTSVDKANVTNTSRLWREVATEYGALHRDVELEHALVDSFAMDLITDPRRYDVVVTENLFGDILTDLAAVLAGSLGVLPSASLRATPGTGRFGMYEPIHGSAPELAGRDVANPVGTILSVALMLHWSFGLPEAAIQIQSAVDAVLSSVGATDDLATEGEALSTTAFTDAVIDALYRRGATDGRRDLRHHVA